MGDLFILQNGLSHKEQDVIPFAFQNRSFLAQAQTTPIDAAKTPIQNPDSC